MYRTPLFISLSFIPIAAVALPEGFVIREFAGPPQVEYPTALSAAANGDVYISSDKNGSLGHEKNFGKIVRARDTNNDGKADDFLDFVPDVNSPRGGHYVGGTFYLIHPPYLSSYRDTNGDGVADEHKQLVKGFGWGIEHPRGADHTTNGVRMGIDGWLYVAVGDFGMADAEAADGKRLILHGGGVVRVRPDGSGMEVYTTATRNICDVAISPYLDLFTRDNTNDGKGWNTRFHHLTHLANAGYPRLYQNFADEAAAPLADYGGGSGTGALYLHEPGFPGAYGDMTYTCDWTTGTIYQHPMKQAGASFTTGQEEFEKLTRAIDIDVDGFSKLYVADWRNGRFNYDKTQQVGMIQQITVPGEKPAAYVEVKKAADGELPSLIVSRSGVQRLEAQREILARGRKPQTEEAVLNLCRDSGQPLYGRVAAIFTYKQLCGQSANAPLLALAEDAGIREFILRAVTDRLGELDGIPAKPYLDALADKNPRVVLQALVGLSRLKPSGSSAAILSSAPGWKDDLRLKHTAVKSLAELKDVPALLDAIEDPGKRDLALRALQEIHGMPAATGLAEIVRSTPEISLREAALITLARLYHVEKPWDLTSWWSTRPDDRGPYFEPVPWEGTPLVKAAIEDGFAKLPPGSHPRMVQAFAKNRIPLGDLKLGDLDPVIVALDSGKIYGAQIPILEAAAQDAKRQWEQRVACYQAVKSAGADFAVTIGILAEWASESGRSPQAEALIVDFINDPTLAKDAVGLMKIGAKGSDAASEIAWKTVLTIYRSPLSKGGIKKKIRERLNKNPRELGFFRAITDLKLAGFEPQIAAAMDSDNKHLIDAATAAKEATAKAGPVGGKKVGKLPAVEVFKLAMAGKGDVKAGERLFTAQGCIACHAIDPKAEQKGPYLGAAGAKFTRDYLIESVIDPGKTVAQGFRTASFALNDGRALMGFVSGEEDGVVKLRDIAGQTSLIKRSDVKEETELPQSMMPPGLADSLTPEEFTSLIEYLVSLKSIGG